MHHGHEVDVNDRRYSDNITNNCKMAFSLHHVLDRLSDKYNF